MTVKRKRISCFNTGPHRPVEIQIERMVVRNPNSHVEMDNICRKVQKKIRQVRQFVNRTGGGVVEGDDDKRERVCGGERKTSRRKEMKGEESPKRTIHRPLVLSITSTVREKCEKKQGTQPVQRTER